MKKIKYRNNSNNYNNQIYSINYKFDSISPAGKCSGTALDLIKRYNELAKEAHGNGNYVEAEVFRQYAEHYRKIVTEINERKNVRFPVKDQNAEVSASQQEEETEAVTAEISPQPVEPKQTAEENALEATFVETKPKTVKKNFTVIEVTDNIEPTKRPYHRKRKNVDETAMNA